MSRRFVKKPIEVEAFLLGTDTRPEWAEIPEIKYYFGFAIIKTLEGEMRAEEGDYIIKGIKGEVYPCKPDIFEASYDEVFNEVSTLDSALVKNVPGIEDGIYNLKELVNGTRILRYILPLSTQEFELELPDGYWLLDIQSHNGSVFMFIQGDLSQKLIKKRFKFFTTGETLEDAFYLKTVMLQDIGVAWHLCAPHEPNSY